MKVSTQDITKAVFQLFLDTGKYVSAADIAKKIGCSTATVYARINECNGVPDHCSYQQRGRGYIYRPTAEYLRFRYLQDT